MYFHCGDKGMTTGHLELTDSQPLLQWPQLADFMPRPAVSHPWTPSYFLPLDGLQDPHVLSQCSVMGSKFYIRLTSVAYLARSARPNDIPLHTDKPAPITSEGQEICMYAVSVCA
jgi:hypothetical protein